MRQISLFQIIHSITTCFQYKHIQPSLSDSKHQLQKFRSIISEASLIFSNLHSKQYIKLATPKLEMQQCPTSAVTDEIILTAYFYYSIEKNSLVR